jgi:hypothetical protein
MEPAQLGVGDVGPDRGDAAGPAGGGLHGVDHRGVVGAVAGGLHDDVAADPQLVPQGEELLLAGIAGGVLAFRCERELRRGPEDVAVGVDRPGRQGKSRVEGFSNQSSQPGVLSSGALMKSPWSTLIEVAYAHAEGESRARSRASWLKGQPTCWVSRASIRG